MRATCLLLGFFLLTTLESPATDYDLFSWERGIGLQPRDQPELKVYLWFYEWNMFGAVRTEQHSRGDWENEVTISPDRQSGEIRCDPWFTLRAQVNEAGAELTLEARNSSDRDWPELAGIIACFNPGPEAIRTEAFTNEKTSFRAPEGLLLLQKREIHWNDNLRPAIDAVDPKHDFAWKTKWPTAAPDARGGLLLRESNDGKWRTGIAWERFLSCQGHNPWKCMHLGIHLGPLAAGEKRTVSGRIYLVEESDRELLDRYDRDFPRPDELSNARPDASKTWLKNMAAHHRFNEAEIRAATGLSIPQVKEALAKADFEIPAPKPADNWLLRVLPYPGGRHPRIGFLEGAVRPQRETKLSIFTPWDHSAYVVADVPEAIWHHRDDGERELLYLAHTHVPTKWTRAEIELEPLEWMPTRDGGFVMKRVLPNGVEFGTRAIPVDRHLQLEQWLTNGTDKALTGLRVQNCVMLKGAPEFAAQTNENKIFREPYAACRDSTGTRWVITAWGALPPPLGKRALSLPSFRSPVRRLPARRNRETTGDVFPSTRANDIEAEFKRIEATGWNKAAD